MNLDRPVSKVIVLKIRRQARQNGKLYVTRSGKQTASKPPPQQAICSCKYAYKDLAPEQKELLWNSTKLVKT